MGKAAGAQRPACTGCRDTPSVETYAACSTSPLRFVSGQYPQSVLPGGRYARLTDAHETKLRASSMRLTGRGSTYIRSRLLEADRAGQREAVWGNQRPAYNKESPCRNEYR